MPMAPFRLAQVPYVSQWDSTAKLSRGDCGIVSACMVALWKNINTTPDEMILKAKLPTGRSNYSFNEIISSAKSVGLNLIYKNNATWEVICSELDRGNPVISLLNYSKISGNQDSFSGSHFWVCLGYDDKFVYVNDPDWWEPKRLQGKSRSIPITEFISAIGDSLIETGNKAFQSLFISS